MQYFREGMNYLLGSKKEFYNFVDSISKDDKVGIVTHIDLDGIASGIFLQKILESKNLKVNFIEFLGYEYDVLKEVLEKDYTKLFFTDWNADNFPEDLNSLRKKGDVLVFDHHPLNEDLKNKEGIIKTESKYCSAHALFDLAKNYFDVEELEWLVCSAIIADYTWDVEENFEFIKSIYPKINKKDIWNSEPGKIAGKISNALIYYKKDLKKVYDFVLKKDFRALDEVDKIIRKEVGYWIGKFEKEVECFENKKLYFYYSNPKFNVASKVASIISTRNPGNTIVFILDDNNKEGFVKLSSRNQSGSIKLGNVLKKCVQGFENSDAGGHDRAAGAEFPKKYLKEFKKRLLEELNVSK